MWNLFYDYQIYIDISDILIYQIPFVVKNVENALRDRTVIYFNIHTKKMFKQNKFEPIWQQMHIFADDIHTVAHFNDVRYISLVYIAYTNNAAIMICFSLSVCITKKIMKVKLMFSFLCGSSKDPGSCRGSFSFQIPGNRSLRAPEIQESKIDENFHLFRVCILKRHGHN